MASLSLKEELVTRLHHQDPQARQIACALLGSLDTPDSWVSRALSPAASNGYTSQLERVLNLEKIVLHHQLSPLWEAALGPESNAIEAVLPQIKTQLDQLSQTGWSDAVNAVTPDEVAAFLGQPIKTHRPLRYRHLLRDVITPILKSRQSPIVVLDAGSSAGAGINEAINAGLSIKKWLAVDLNEPGPLLPWILTCSTRVNEISTSESVRDMVKFFTSHSTLSESLTSDITDLKAVDTGSVDLYLAIYTFYQLTNPQQAISEAFRVTTEDGLIMITDNIISTDSTLHFTSPGDPRSSLSTIVWINTKPTPIGPIPVYEWLDTDFKTGRSTQRQTASSLYQTANDYATLELESTGI